MPARRFRQIRAFVITESHSAVVYAQSEEIAYAEFQANPSVRRTTHTIKTAYAGAHVKNLKNVPTIAARLT